MNTQACVGRMTLSAFSPPLPFTLVFSHFPVPQDFVHLEMVFVSLFIMSHWLLLQVSGELGATDQLIGNGSPRQLPDTDL